MPTGGVDVVAGAGALASAFGAASPVIGAGLAGLEGGAALGGLESAVTGGNVGQGILHGGEAGALTGGGIGLGGDLLGSTIGTTAADALGGAAGGALGGVATGGKALTGALEGGAAGTLAGLTSSGNTSSTGAAPASGGVGASAAGAAAPAGITPDVGLPQDSTLGSSLTSSGNVGAGTTGTSSLPNGLGSDVGSQFAQAAGVNTSLSAPGVDTLAAGGGASGTGVSATTPSSIQNLVSGFDKSNLGLNSTNLSNIGNVVTSNPGAAISAAGLGLDVLKGSQQSAAEKSLKSQAGQLNAQGQQLEGYLQSGTLPPGLQAGVNQASESAKATIRSQYASRGMSGSSAEQQDLAAVDSRAQAQGAQMAMQLLQTGISETGMSSELYNQILQQQTQQDSSLSSAIGNFASAAGGGSTGKGGEFILKQA